MRLLVLGQAGPLARYHGKVGNLVLVAMRRFGEAVSARAK